MSLKDNNLDPKVIVAAGFALTLLGVVYGFTIRREYTDVRQTASIGPDIGDQINPYSGQLVTNGTNTVRVDLTGKLITITEIKNTDDQKKWESEQRDRPPATVMLAHDPNISLSQAVSNETLIFTTEMHNAARQKEVAQDDNNRAVDFARAGSLLITGLALCGLGAQRAANRRR
jgi:hypothetical protein